MSEADVVLSERRDAVALITLNRPEKRNALNGQLRCAFLGALDAAARDHSVRAVIVTGAGDKAFVAGADIGEFDGRSPVDQYRVMKAPSIYDAIERSAKPVIAAINGYCLAGGLELALACDIRIAAEHAEFALKEVQRGIIPGGGGTQRLPRAIPLNIALELMLTGDHIDAREAHRLGLVNHVVPAEQLMPTAEAIAHKICANAPLAVRAIKEAAYRGLDTTLDEGLRLESLLAKAIRHTEDSKEGPRAFAEKRPAVFKGQ